MVLPLLFVSAIAVCVYRRQQRGLSRASSIGRQLRRKLGLGGDTRAFLRSGQASAGRAGEGGGAELMAGRPQNVAAAQRALERAVQRGRTSLSSPTDEDVDALSAAIEAAEAAGVDSLAVSAARRRLHELEESAHRAKTAQATGRLAKALAAVEAILERAPSDAVERAALTLLLHVYSKHPPQQGGSLSVEALREIEAAEPGAQPRRVQKALLKGQRDYHPDRNAGVVRATLGLSPEEWEVLCLTICQQLALAYDKLVKGDRERHSSGGNV